MKIKPSFVLREIAEEYLVVPIGEEAEKVKGLLSLNASGAFLWGKLETEQTEDDLVKAMTENYKVEENTARQDVSKFVAELEKIGCLQK